ncbi:putative ABC transport system permease protein [Kordia periserrulae]|uniref:Putative ABC transport system permease protein n=1 Tax=Kordia periserrulae TaxID=701523 RepID=A0A2T6C4C2_9FLAO|nr:ABC transporter permease [Kordia periserrulae]PTX63158.1 putative ABC transport system permease protein [Kordia periserrulae]
MIGNYLKIAWRNLRSNKEVFLINILGLAIGIASFLILMLYVVDELSYDKHHENADNIVRIVTRGKIGDNIMNQAHTQGPIADVLQREFPEVKNTARLRKLTATKIVYGNNTFRDGKVAMIDPSFLQIFTIPFVKGNAATALNEPNSIVIDEEQAKKYFGNQNPLNKIVKYGESGQSFKVTGVFEKIPTNSHFHFDHFITTTGVEYASNDNWTSSDFHTYVLLSDDVSAEAFESKLPKVVEKYMGAQMEREMGITFSEFIKSGNKFGLFVQPLEKIHLYSDFSGETELESGGDIKKLYIFGSVAFFMLLVACINFMNLSTATATQRSKEVGIRKVLGSNKKQLVLQFLAESFIITLIATIIGYVVVLATLGLFNNLSGKELELSFMFTPKVIFIVLMLIVLVSIMAGGYPAFYMSSFQPIKALKSKFSGSGKGKGIRSILVILQFVISSGLILLTILVGKQMQYIQDKDVGYEKENLIVIRNAKYLRTGLEAFKNQLLNDPRVENVTISSYVPVGETNSSSSGIFINQKFNRVIDVYNVDENYIPTLKMKVVEGRNFSKSFADSLNIIINETAASELGFGKEALNKTLSRETPFGLETLTVVGVVKDFNYKSLHKKIDPLIMVNRPFGGLIIRSKTSDLSGLINKIGNTWSEFKVGEPFSYTIMENSFSEQYEIEEKMGTILKIFALLTIIIACLGLFGLVTFTAAQRFKEIGIRKTLGSSTTQIVTLLASDFLKLILISLVIAFPIAYYFMNKWLQDFAYRVNIGVMMFILTAFVIIVIALLTITVRSVKAANANPIDSLRTE